MSKRKARPARSSTPARPSPTPPSLAGVLAGFESLGAWTRPACLFAASALLMVTPLVPSESAAAKGTALPLVMLWLALLAAWLLAALSRERVELRCGWTDGAFALLLGWHSLSGLVMAWQGNPRQTLNMLWTWIGFGAAYFAVRQLLRAAAECRAICAVMISLAVGLSGLGLFQFAYEAPLQRAEYKAKSQEEQTELIRRETGIYAPEGSRQRELFESRLQSKEPLATFALTNSLAGFLAAWLIVVLGIAVVEWSGGRLFSRNATEGVPYSRESGVLYSRESGVPYSARAGVPTVGKTIAVLAFSALLIGVCLLLTKSRTAWLACALGLPLVIFFCREQGRWPKWLIPALGGAVVATIVIAVGAVAAGGLDGEVFSSASKTVLYRLEYWRSSLSMIGEHPWFGCGPGNFQEYYTAYKLPQANESIADPHNFIMEVWATAGTPALLALLAVIGTFAWTLWRCRSSLPGSTESRPAGGTYFGSRPAGGTYLESYPRAILFGGLAGLVLAFPLCTLVGFPLTNLRLPEMLRGVPLINSLEFIPALWVTALPLAALTGYLLMPWVESGRLPSVLPTIAVFVLLVNFLAAGGIGYPGVANSLWLLVAVALNMAPDERNNGPSLTGCVTIPRIAVGGLLLLIMGLVFLCQSTAYAPVLAAAAEMARGRQFEADQKPQAAASAFAAAKADIFAPEPWEQLARLALSKWMYQPNERNLAALDAAISELKNRDPRSSDVRMRIGDWYVLAFRHRPDPPLIERAVQAYEESAERYPNSSLVHARLAWAQALAKNIDSAQREAAEALRLDDLCPHEDMKLARQSIFDPGPGKSPTAGVPDKPEEANAEELMRRLLKQP